jgi:hypothetical protein
MPNSNSYGQFWYGNQIGFPGFLYKRGTAGARRSTKFAAGGNKITNTPQNINNKYHAGNNGIGSTNIAVRRAKNRLASTCNGTKCFSYYNNLAPPNGSYKYII